MSNSILLVSRHDYRTGWRANLHFLADAYVALEDRVSFVSAGFSPLSLLASDHRKGLFKAANRWEEHAGVGCFLWRSALHPFGKGLGPLRPLTNGLFRWWITSACAELDTAAAKADLILVESGLTAALIGRLRKAAPGAKIIYLVSDLLETVDAHPFIAGQLFRDRAAIDAIVVCARAMAPHFDAFERPVHFIPHGIAKSDFSGIGPSPYRAETNIVTVGSMLFDASFVQTAAAAFPKVRFHLIGTPALESVPANVTEYGRMPFRDTLPFLKHADAGAAPYHDQDHADYLSDSSMKLMQYGYLNLPAICPDFAAGDKANRHGYRPGDRASIEAAVQKALDTPFAAPGDEVLDWTEVAARFKAL